MTFLIDGFNLIYKFPELEGLMYEGKLNEARKGLLNRLRDLIKIAGGRFRVVFDGRKDVSMEIRREKVGYIDVYYSLDFSADHLIKQFIKKDPNPRMTTVVTSDKDIIAFVSRFRARVKTSEEFADYYIKTIEKWHEEQTPEKEEDPVVTEEEISFWENIFKRKK